MHFHKVHGRAVQLSEGGLVARRGEDFCNGIAFSSHPVKVSQKLCLELTQGRDFSGALRLGVTTQDPGRLSPSELPRYACPDLTNKPGFWARGLKESYAQTGNRVTFYVNSQGQMHYFVNNEHKGLLLNHLPTNAPLWLLCDLYGNTTGAKFVSSDEAPVEIIARGPDALHAYHQSCESGMQSVFRTRLMLVGQDRVGKTSLKKSLLGLEQTEEEESTDGIDLSASCSFNLRDRSSWKVALTRQASIPLEEPITSQENGSIDSLEEEYHQALATNIVQELLHRRRQKEKEEKEQQVRRRDSRSALHTAGKKKKVPTATLR